MDNINPAPTPIEQAQNLLNIVQQPNASNSTALLSNVLADTLGMSMHNAVTQQQNAQMLNSASTTAACARILNAFAPVPFEPWKKNDECETGETGC